MLDFSFELFGIGATSQLLFNGITNGMVFGLLAMGVVLIYRSTKVINFAVANMGLPTSVLMALLVLNWDVPYWIALFIALVLGTALAMLIELLVITRLFAAPRVILLVATIGIAQLMQALVQALPDITTEGRPRFPVPVGGSWDDVAGLRMTGPEVTILVVVPVVAAILGYVMNRTTFGKTVQASATNPNLARTLGISPQLVSTAVWSISGFLATLSIILLSGSTGALTGFNAIGPTTLVRALAAAVLAKMVSFPRALLAGIGIGVAQSVVQFNFLNQAGLVDFLLFIAVVIAVYFQGREESEKATFSFAPKVKPIPERLASRWWIRNMSTLAIAVIAVLAALVPVLVTANSKLLTYSAILAFGMCALSVTVITGWSGQLSLGQMALAGLGGFGAAAFQRAGVPFVLALVGGAFIGAAAATLVGLGALRVKGLFLAVSTFALGLAAEEFIYKRDFVSDGNRSTVPFDRGSFFGIDLADERSYYWFSLVALLLVMVLVSRIRRSGIGRTTIAVRDNPDTSAAYTVSALRTRLTTFAFAGALAGLGGGFLGATVQRIPLSGQLFVSFQSLRVVSMAVIGGLGTLFGPVLGAFWVEGLSAIFSGNELIPLFTSSIGLLILLLYFPGGLVQIGFALRDGLLGWLERRLPEEEASASATAPPSTISRKIEGAERVPATLSARDISVRFGGNHAVNNVSIEVDDGEIVGLIGTNGAGKSTLMNAIGGFVPSTGEVTIGGKNVAGMSSANRAKQGLGRTFQAASLFPELTVRETVQVALEARGRTGFISTALFLPHAAAAERRKKSEATDLIDFLGLGRYADAYIADLSTGTRRIVELAGLLALDARVLCMDEPTAGLAQRETEAFGPLLVNLRRELDASILIIEHDMPLIMSISDRVYCLESGEVIAEGEPDYVRNNPLVVASYLGTDSRAIDRSES